MDINEDLWKDIPEFEGLYQAHPTGLIRSIKFGKVKILKPALNTFGYEKVIISNKTRQYQKLVSRLVAQTFIPNPSNLPCVNHKNEIKTDNRVENLEWCTYKYNLDYSGNYLKAHDATKVKVYCFTEEGNFIRSYDSINEASEDTGESEHIISNMVLGKSYRTRKGYIWKLF